VEPRAGQVNVLEARAGQVLAGEVSYPASFPGPHRPAWPARWISADRDDPLGSPAPKPRANAYAGRFVLTARTEVTDRMLFSERHLRMVLAEYEARYNGQRPHRSRRLRAPRPDHTVADLSRKQIKRRPVLGGLINEIEASSLEAQVKSGNRVLEPYRMGRLPGVRPIVSGRRVNDSAPPSGRAAGVAAIVSRAGPWVSGPGSPVLGSGSGCGAAA
jgi:hypothetical protein